jgi:ribonuclease P protein component
MLSQPHRLPAFEISRVMRTGKRTTGNGIVIISLKNETNVSRFAFIVSTKIDKRATVRNRIRRVMSESVRLILSSITKSIDYVVIARRDLTGLDQKEVGKRIENVLHLIA